MGETRPFGDTGMDLTPLGFGTWVISGAGWQYSWGATDDADSIVAIRHAVAGGLNWIDTAPAYGLGHAEELVGRALAGLPAAERPYLFTFTTDLPANLALVEALRPIAARYEVSVAEVALAWTVAWPGVTGAIVGARTPAQIDGWIGANTLALTETDLTEIAAAITATGAGTGPARGAEVTA